MPGACTPTLTGYFGSAVWDVPNDAVRAIATARTRGITIVFTCGLMTRLYMCREPPRAPQSNRSLIVRFVRKAGTDGTFTSRNLVDVPFVPRDVMASF